MESHTDDDQPRSKTSIKPALSKSGARLILALVVAVILVLAATYWGLFHVPAVLSGQVASLVL